MPFHSTVTATRLDTATLDAEHWFRNLRQPIRFAEVVADLAENGHGVFIEMSAHPVLTGGVSETLAATGRDGTAFDHPDQFDPHRTGADRHLAFGQGLHYCLGANLGKLEAQIAIAELARRYPVLRLVPGQHLTFHPNISFRGPQSLLVVPRRALRPSRLPYQGAFGLRGELWVP